MRYWDDFAPERVHELGSWTVTRSAIVDFASKSDPPPFHVNEAAGRETISGGIIASGWHMASICMRLYVDALLGDAASLGSPACPRSAGRRRCGLETPSYSRSRGQAVLADFARVGGRPGALWADMSSSVDADVSSAGAACYAARVRRSCLRWVDARHHRLWCVTQQTS